MVLCSRWLGISAMEKTPKNEFSLFFGVDFSARIRRESFCIAMISILGLLACDMNFQMIDKQKTNHATSSTIANLKAITCPDSLLPVGMNETWDWEPAKPHNLKISMSSTWLRFNYNKIIKPQVVVFSLESERNSTYLNKTLDSLDVHNYKNYCVTGSVDGNAWDESGYDVASITNVSLAHEKPGKRGVFLSHLGIWRLAMKYDVPIIALETDTSAISDWNIPLHLYKDYDIIFLHSHKHLPRKCEGNKLSVREGLKYWYAAGAILFTNHHPERVYKFWKEELLSGNKIDTNWDHWLNKVWEGKKLRVGSLCPHLFDQRQDHVSTITGLSPDDEFRHPSWGRNESRREHHSRQRHHLKVRSHSGKKNH